MDLPDHYPLANASWAEKDTWLAAEVPPYDRIREAAPWLRTDEQIRWYLDGLREAQADPTHAAAVAQLFGPALAQIKIPQ